MPIMVAVRQGLHTMIKQEAEATASRSSFAEYLPRVEFLPAKIRRVDFYFEFLPAKSMG